MQCPKCDGEMNQVADDPVGIHRCNQCHGLYFSHLTQGLLAQITTSLDTGDEELGAEYNEMVYVDCPNCFKIMDQRMVEEPVKIRFELCPSCYATFLDAGEYRQYMSEQYREAFMALLPAE